MLLHNTNLKANVPVAFAVQMTESYESMQTILDCISYKEHMWKLCSDLKVVAFLNGLQSGNTKYPCFKCLWDSRSRDQYSRKEWPLRNATEGEFNVIKSPLVPPEKILLPPLHIKLGLFKSFLKFMQRQNDGAKEFLQRFFPSLSPAKLREGIFCNLCLSYGAFIHEFCLKIGVLVGPDIRRLIASAEFESTLSEVELKAWRALKNVTANFLGKRRSDNYESMVQEMLDGFQAININMSPKIHFMNSHLDAFARQLPTESDEHGERFHQVCKPFEYNYKGKSLVSLIADLCWQLASDEVPDAKKKKIQ